MKITKYIERYQKLTEEEYVNLLDLHKSNNIKHKYPKKSRLSSSTEYSVDDALIIGVTGVWGKTSTVYHLSNYFKAKGYRVVAFSTLGWDCPSIGKNPYTKEVDHLPIPTQEDFVCCLYGAMYYEAEVIIVECHPQVVDIFKNLTFNYKLLTKFVSSIYDTHMGKEAYTKAKIDIFRNIPCPAVLEASTDKIADFIDACGDNEVTLFTYGRLINNKPTYWEKFYNKTIAPYTSKEVECKLNYKNCGINKSYIEYNLGENNYSLHTSLSGIAVNNLIGVATLLYKLDEWDENLFNNVFGENVEQVPGRYEHIKYNNKDIIIDYGKLQALEVYGTIIHEEQFNEWDSHYYENKFGELMEELNHNKLKALFSVVGYNDYDSIVKNRFFLTPFFSYSEEVIKNIELISGNTYKLIYDSYPDMTKFKYIKAEDIVTPYKGSLTFAEIEQFKANLKEIYERIYPKSAEPEQSPLYNNDVVLCLFSDIDYQELNEKILDYFKSLANIKLSEAIDNLNNYKEIINSHWQGKDLKKAIGILDDQNISCITYITSRTSCFDYQTYMIHKQYQTAYKDKTVEVPYRKQAIVKAIFEAGDNDLIIINGRGDCRKFAMKDRIEYWSDKEFIENLTPEEIDYWMNRE